MADPQQPTPFPFGVDFQVRLIKTLMLEAAGELVMERIQPNYFETQELRWIYTEISTYYKQYNGMPTWLVLQHKAQQADTQIRPTVVQLVAYLKDLAVPEEAWIRSTVLEWVRENLFHTAFIETRGLWAAGQRSDAITHMAKSVDRINEAVFEQIDRGWFFEELGSREAVRLSNKNSSESIPTAIQDLDKLLNGGLTPGELGIWIAYAKGGKSTQLMNHGAMAVRTGMKRVLHFVLEGSRAQIETRYDALIASFTYNELKKGGLSSTAYNQLWTEYQQMRGKLVLRAFTKDWNCTILNIEQELKDLRKQFGWIPELIIIDYADLVGGRNPPYSAPWLSQFDSIRDMKALANRGYPIWTATQANYPSMKDPDLVEHIIPVSYAAGAKEKLRVADYVGSINSTIEEKKKGIARLFSALYRDNEAGLTTYIQTDLAKMKMGGQIQPPGGVGIGPKPPGTPTLGYS